MYCTYELVYGPITVFARKLIQLLAGPEPGSGYPTWVLKG
jgi:hypothetical protein